MNSWLLTGIGCVYLYVAYGYFRLGRIGMGFAFIAYACANLALVRDLWEGR